MSKNEKAAADAPAEQKRAQQPIPVKSLSTQAGATVDFAGKHGSQSVTWTWGGGTGKGWEIHYLPWLRHHRVVFHHGDGKGTDVTMIPETWVSWRPREEQAAEAAA